MDPRPRYRSLVFDSSRWDGFAFRDDDIVICTPPKCGTTWMQMLCALLIFRTPGLPAPLAELSPWLDMQTRPLPEVLRDLDAQEHRRFIKTHCPLDGMPFDPRVTYINVARDPRDVALSFDNHMANIDMARLFAVRASAVGTDDFEELGITGPPPTPPDDPVERFWQWIDAEQTGVQSGGLPAVVHSIGTFWEARDRPNVHLFHYSDLTVDLAGQMVRLAGVLGVAPPTGELVEAAGFAAMKGRADQLVPNSDTPMWRSNDRFFDQGRLGAWRAILDEDGLRRYHGVLAGLAPPDLAAYLDEGWLGAEAH